MRLVLKTILMSIAILLIISPVINISEALEPYFNREFRKEPPTGNELKLISMDIPQTRATSENVKYWATIRYDAGFKPGIRRACFNFSGDRESCVDVEAKDVTSKYFRVPIHIPVGSKRVDCYAEYTRDGKISRTNVITYYFIILKDPEE